MSQNRPQKLYLKMSVPDGFSADNWRQQTQNRRDLLQKFRAKSEAKTTEGEDNGADPDNG